MSWQRANIQAAANYLREKMAASGSDVRAKAVYEGLLDVLEPTRRATRMQREMAVSAKAAVSVKAERDRREKDRRTGPDRRAKELGAPGGLERRRTRERRTGADRRHGGR
jgi:hypothetical protein